MRKVEFEPYIFSENVEIYAIKIDNESYSEYKKFFIKFKDTEDFGLRENLAEIIKTIEKIAQNGVLEYYFRNEGCMGDRVCAIPINFSYRGKKNGVLRVYCIRISDKLLILGGGGIKKTQTYQEDSELLDKVKTLQCIDGRLSDLEREGIDVHKEIINLELEIN